MPAFDQHDLRAYLAAGHNLIAGRNIYREAHRSIPEDPTLTSDIPEYIYPPLLAILFAPVSLLFSHGKFRWFWVGLNFACLAHSLYLLDASALVYLGLFAPPALWLYATGNIDGIILWLCVMAWKCPVLACAGLCGALAVSIKITPALPMMVLMAFRGAEFSAWIIFWGGIALAVMLARRDLLCDYLLDILPKISKRLDRPPQAQSLPTLLRGRRLLFARLGFVAIIFLLYPLSPNLSVAWSLVCACALPPLGWTMQFVNVLPIVALCGLLVLPVYCFGSSKKRFALLSALLCLIVDTFF